MLIFRLLNMLLFTIVKCYLCFLHLFPMARLRAKSGNSLPPISPGRSAGESNYHKIESFQFLLLQYKWRQGDQPPPGPTQSSQRWWVSPSSRTGGLASTWATQTSSTGPEFSRCLNLKEIGKKIQSFTLLRSFMDCLFLQLWHSSFLLDSTSSSTRPLSK